MSYSPRSMRFAHALHLCATVASMLVSVYVASVGYNLHRDTMPPGGSLWHWSGAAWLMLIGVVIFHLGIWRLLHTIRALRQTYGKPSPNDTNA